MIIYLKTINGIKVQCSENENQLLYLNTDLSVHKVLDRSLKEMKYVILNENLLYPELFYTEYYHIYKKSHGDTFTKQEVRHDITFSFDNLYPYSAEQLAGSTNLLGKIQGFTSNILSYKQTLMNF